MLDKKWSTWQQKIFAVDIKYKSFAVVIDLKGLLQFNNILKRDEKTTRFDITLSCRCMWPILDFILFQCMEDNRSNICYGRIETCGGDSSSADCSDYRFIFGAK